MKINASDDAAGDERTYSYFGQKHLFSSESHIIHWLLFSNKVFSKAGSPVQSQLCETSNVFCEIIKSAADTQNASVLHRLYHSPCRMYNPAFSIAVPDTLSEEEQLVECESTFIDVCESWFSGQVYSAGVTEKVQDQFPPFELKTCSYKPTQH